MKKVEVKLFDGFILDRGYFPFFFARGTVPRSINRAYVVTPDCIKHELYGMLLRDVGVEEGSRENYCTNEDCFASHGVRYDPHAGLCEKHSKLIADLKGKVQMNISNILFCHSLREEKLRDGISVYEREFGEQTETEIESISFSRAGQKLRDGNWLFIYKDRDELLTKYDEGAHGALEVCRLISMRPYQNLEEFNSHMKNDSFGESVLKSVKSLLPFTTADELKSEELAKLLPEMSLNELICSLEGHEHGSRLTFNEAAQSYRINEKGREYLSFWTDFLKNPEKKLKELERELLQKI